MRMYVTQDCAGATKNVRSFHSNSVDAMLFRMNGVCIVVCGWTRLAFSGSCVRLKAGSFNKERNTDQ